jgi:hypothetical protein
MSHKPTPEQQAVIDAYAAGESLVVVAVAGAGKTTTLKMAANATGRRALYVAYNKALAEDAKASMPPTVECRTAHSLAYREVGWQYKHRLGGKRLSGRAIAELMYAGGRIGATRVLNSPVDIGIGIPLRQGTIASLAMETVKRWCFSADPAITIRHLPHRDGITGLARQALADIVLPIADLAWKDLIHPSGKLPFIADHYLKLWALSEPRIPYGSILFDEAQDANKVLTKILTDQRDAQLVAVGDPCQQLYAWRGSVDALATWPADRRLALSQSFRFGPAVAGRANVWLDLLNAETRVVGAPWIDSRVAMVDQPDAILCRTNAGAMKAVMDRLAGDAGTRVHLVGGGDAIRRLAEAADQLQHGEPCDHPELIAFSDWAEVQEYVMEADGSDLAPLVKLVDEYGTGAIIAAAEQLAPKAGDADLIVSTGHKSKGLQWPAVQTGPDFKEPQPRPWPTPDSPRKAIVLQRGELMLGYVAVTRAEQLLDDASVAWAGRVSGWGFPVVVVGEDGRPVTGHPVGVDGAPSDALRAATAVTPTPPVLVEPCEAGGWLSAVCLRCHQPWRECECRLGPDRWRSGLSETEFTARVASLVAA